MVLSAICAFEPSEAVRHNKGASKMNSLELPDGYFGPKEGGIGISKIGAANFANQVREILGFTDPYLKVDLVASRYNGFVSMQRSTVPNLMQNEASLVVPPTGFFTIYLDPLSRNSRNRFSTAHELGHYILHYLLPLRVPQWDPNVEASVRAQRRRSSPRDP